jgi:hypothetical protein
MHYKVMRISKFLLGNALLAGMLCSIFFFANLFSYCEPAKTASITVVSASYGKEAKTCDARQYFAGRCNRRDRCEVMATNSICGDSVPYVVKQLDVAYRCDSGAIRHASAMEYFLIELSCLKNPRLQIAETSVKVLHGEATTSLQPNCMDQNLREGSDKNLDPNAACKKLCISLPARAKIRKVYGFAREVAQEEYLPCQIDTAGVFYPEKYCNIEGSAFYPHYHLTPNVSGLDVCWTFRNWNLQREREAKLFVQYEK